MKASHAVRVALVPMMILVGLNTTSAQDAPGRQDTIKLTLSATSAGLLGLGDRLRVVVNGLQAAAAANQIDPKRLVLALNGYALQGLQLERSQDTLVFTLVRGDSSRTAWTALLGAPTWRIRQMTVGVMRADGRGIPWLNPRTPGVISFRLFAAWRIWLAALLAVGSLVAIGVGLKMHLIAREPTQPLRPDDKSAKPGVSLIDDKNAKPALSLGQLQLLWWTYLIVCGFLFVWLLTGDYNGIVTSQGLILMGVSMAATTVARAVGNGTRNSALRDIQELLETGETTAAGVRATEIRHLIGRMGKPAGLEWWRDLFEVEAGLSISRIQYALWTVVLGIVWVIAVFQRLSFPEFDATLLALMGISGGAYILPKITEQNGASGHTRTERVRMRFGAERTRVPLQDYSGFDPSSVRWLAEEVYLSVVDRIRETRR